MAYERPQATQDGRGDLFALFDMDPAGQEAAPQPALEDGGAPSTVEAVSEETPPPELPAPAETPQPAKAALPEGWTTEDIRFLLEKLEAGPLLVADTQLGIQTIHSRFGAEAVHCGFGLFKVKGAGFTLHFDAGGAMERTPSGKGWTRLQIDGEFTFDSGAVKAKLEEYLQTAAPADPAGEEAGAQIAGAAEEATDPSGRSDSMPPQKRDLNLTRYFLAFERADALRHAAGDASRLEVMCAGREALLKTGEIVTIAGSVQIQPMGEFIETAGEGENLTPPGTVLVRQPGESRRIHYRYVAGLLFDQAQLDLLCRRVPRLRELAVRWTDPEAHGADQSEAPEQLEKQAEPVLEKVPLKEQVRQLHRDLGQFTGTTQWTRVPALCPHIVLLTDGVLYLAEHGGENGGTAYWLIDAIASYQGEEPLKRHDFQFWKLIVHPPGLPGPEESALPNPLAAGAVLESKHGEAGKEPVNGQRHASLICTNGNEKELVRQEIGYTDFLPAGEVRIYASIEEHPDISTERKVMILLLPSEY
jgi:hypothetical protein